jgi:hypothetical protein
MLDTAGATAEAAPKRIPVWSWRDAIAKANIPPLTKLVCYDISRYLSDAGKSWRIPVKDIIRDTGLSNRAVATHLANAVAAGLLVIRREMGADGRRGVSKYVPKFPDYMDLAREPAEPMQDVHAADGPSDECSRGRPREEYSRGPCEPSSSETPSPREAGSRQESFHQKDALHQQASSHQGDAQARPAPKVEPIDVVQPKGRKPKAAKTDLLGDVPVRNKRNTLTTFPENPDPDVVAQWIDYGLHIGLTEDQAKGCILKEGKYYSGTGKRMANWTPIMEGELIKCRERLAKERTRAANSARRGPVSNDDAFAMAGI